MRYTSYFLLVLFCLLFVRSATGQEIEAPIADDLILEEKPLEKSLLWEVTHKDLSVPSYVFGTIHIIDKEDYFFPQIAQQSLTNSKQVAFEVDMDDMNDMSMMMSLFQDAMMKDGVTLKDLLTEEEYTAVSEHFQKMGLPIMLLERIKPMFLSVFASGDIEMGSLQSGDMMSYEVQLHEQAKAENKEVFGLETIDFQLSLFDSIPYEAQAKMLVDGIQMGSDDDTQFEDMFKTYKEQDIEAMHELIGSDEGGMGEFEHLLVRGRNENWIPKMKDMMAQASTFFAVGAGHLGGTYGVIRLLKSEGYTLTPLMHVQGLKKI